MTGINTASLRIAKPDGDKDATDYYCEVRMTGVDMPVTTGRITLAVEGEKPAMDEVTLEDGAVALPYTYYQLSASHSPTRFNVSGLPAGLQCDPLSGWISGTPAQGGTFSVKISASNPVGTSPVVTAKLIVTKLDRALVGTSTGLVLDSSGYFATLSITVSESGHFTGKAGSTSNSGRLTTSSFAGQLAEDGLGGFSGDSSHFKLPALDAESGVRDCYFSVAWEPGGGLRAPMSMSDDITSYQYLTTTLNHNQWNARTNPAKQYAGYYTVAMDHEQAGVIDSGGSGYAAFTVTAGGTFTYTGHMPDGTAFAIPAFLDQEGISNVLAWMYGYKGQLAGTIVLGTGSPPSYRDTDVQGVLHWHRPVSTLVAEAQVDSEYFNGIDRDFALQGARYLPPNIALATGPYMMDAGAPPANIEVSVSGVATGGYAVYTDASLSTRHIASFPVGLVPGSPLRLSSLAFNAATGGFSGTATYYVFSDETGAVQASYPTAFQGIVTRKDAASTQGYGTGYYARLFPYAIYSPDPDITRPLQQFNVLYSGGVHVQPK